MSDIDEQESFLSPSVQVLFDALRSEDAHQEYLDGRQPFSSEGTIQWDTIAEVLPG